MYGFELKYELDEAGIAGAPLYEGRLYTGCGRNNKQRLLFNLLLP
jgi:hypothetical protein